MDRLRWLWDRYGGTLEVRREGKCRKCGTRIGGRTMAHGDLVDMGSGTMCKGRPKGPYRYVMTAAIVGHSHPAKDVPWLADDLAALRKRAVKERRSLYENVNGSRD